MGYKKNIVYFVLITLIFLAIFGLQPFQKTIDAERTLVNQSGIYENEVRRLPDASYLVSVRTSMPEVEAKMVRWWFADFLQTSEHYNLWHPKDHVWMDWENKKSGKIIGASHLVHEYIGGDLSKLRIQFVNPVEFFDYDANNENTFVICARVGLLEQEINIAKMCHIVVDTSDGAEMRSRFWLGHIAKRKGNEIIPSVVGMIGNTFLVRLLALNKKNAIDLKRHAEEEMKYLGELLPPLYLLKNNNQLEN